MVLGWLSVNKRHLKTAIGILPRQAHFVTKEEEMYEVRMK
jgi:hypothetical protein